MRILLTGGKGFLGHALYDRLVKAYGVENVLAPGSQRLDLIEDFHDGVTRIDNYIHKYTIDTIIHLAAICGGIGFNRDNPATLIQNNTQMGINLLEAAKRTDRIKKIVTLGSICAYPKVPKTIPFVEDEMFDGLPEETNSYYGESKRLLFLMGKAYRKQYGMNVIHLMPTNLAGRHDHFEVDRSHVIPALIRRFSEAKDLNSPYVTLWGDGSASREFLHVEDCARAIQLALEKYNGEEPVNIGNGREISIMDLALKIKTLVGYEGNLEWDTTKPNGQPRRCLDVSRAKKLFGFEAEKSIDDILKDSYEWYQYLVSMGGIQ